MDRRILIGLGIGILILLGIIIFFRYSNNSSRSGDATISGTFNINGVIPDNATVTIYGSEYDPSKGASCPKDNVVAKDLPAKDGGSWSFSNLASGTTYVGCADIIANGKTVSSSDTLTVTAPASNEEIVFNIETINGDANAIISGNIVVHGYIPSGSTITIEGRVAGVQNYSVVTENLPAKPSQKGSYSKAIAGESYEIMGVLYDSSGKRIGSSDKLVVTAPAVNEVLVINSNATPPTGGTGGSPTKAPANKTISGTINFNGVAPANSRIVILQKENNASDYQVAVDNVDPVDGAKWSWNGASESTWYDIEAVLKQKQSNNTDKDVATSPSVSVAAPATGVTLSINSGLSNPAPTRQMTLSCNSQSGDNWNAQLTIPYVAGAQTYWYQVGTSNGSSDVANTTVGANGSNDVQVSATLANQKTYYFRYAYANVSGVGVGNSQFSPFSATSQGSCGF